MELEGQPKFAGDTGYAPLAAAPTPRVGPASRRGLDDLLSALMDTGRRLDVGAGHAPESGSNPSALEQGDIRQFVDHVSSYLSGHDALRAMADDLADVIFSGGGLGLITELLNRPGIVDPRTGGDQPHLSRREVEVLREASHDISQQEIADRLCISTRTVSTHLQNIYQKLGVRTPMRAVASAVALGYIHVQDIGFLEPILSGQPGSAIDTLGMLAQSLRSRKETPPVAMSGLLLLLFSSMAARHAQDNAEPGADGNEGVVCEVDARGQVLREFDKRRPEGFLAMAVAPAHAAREGFSPGHVFVVSSRPACGGHARITVLELTAQGQRVREMEPDCTFAGRPSACGMAFGPRGRLLLAMGGASDGIVAIARGGAVQDRFAAGRFEQICSSPCGKLYAVETLRVGCAVRVFGSSGRILHSLCNSSPLGAYRGVAVDARGRIFTVRREEGACRLEQRDADGRVECSMTLPGADAGGPAVGADGYLYVPHAASGRISVVSTAERLVRSFQLAGALRPAGLTVGAANRLWVCGLRARV